MVSYETKYYKKRIRSCGANIASCEAKSSGNSVPSKGTDLKASSEASAPLGTIRYASCKAKNLVSSETKYYKKRIRSCGANLASCEAEVLLSSTLKKASAKAKYHPGTTPNQCTKCFKALSTDNTACAKAKCLENAALHHSAEIQPCKASPGAWAPWDATDAVSLATTRKAFFKERQLKMAETATQGVESKSKGVMVSWAHLTQVKRRI